jgi:hypothetical protein
MRPTGSVSNSSHGAGRTPPNGRSTAATGAQGRGPQTNRPTGQAGRPTGANHQANHAGNQHAKAGNKKGTDKGKNKGHDHHHGHGGIDIDFGGGGDGGGDGGFVDDDTPWVLGGGPVDIGMNAPDPGDGPGDGPSDGPGVDPNDPQDVPYIPYRRQFAPVPAPAPAPPAPPSYGAPSGGGDEVSMNWWVGYNPQTQRYSIAFDSPSQSGMGTLIQAGCSLIVAGPSTYSEAVKYIAGQ